MTSVALTALWVSLQDLLPLWEINYLLLSVRVVIIRPLRHLQPCEIRWLQSPTTWSLAAAAQAGLQCSQDPVIKSVTVWHYGGAWRWFNDTEKHTGSWAAEEDRVKKGEKNKRCCRRDEQWWIETWGEMKEEVKERQTGEKNAWETVVGNIKSDC